MRKKAERKRHDRLRNAVKHPKGDTAFALEIKHIQSKCYNRLARLLLTTDDEYHISTFLKSASRISKRITQKEIGNIIS
jgi:hypothetical protein